MENNWALSVDQCRLKALQFWVHLINLLSILLRCNGFARIQKAIVDQVGSRPTNSDHDHFWVQIWLWEVLWSIFLEDWLVHDDLTLMSNCCKPGLGAGPSTGTAGPCFTWSLILQAARLSFLIVVSGSSKRGQSPARKCF